MSIKLITNMPSVTKKIALVHDWIVGVGGAEKVLKAFHEMFPEAPIYVLFYNPEFTEGFMPNADIRPTFLQKPYRFFGSHKMLVPFIPLAVESIDLSDYDLVVSSGLFTKGLILKPQTIHVSYCSSPTRQVWDWQAEYRKESRLTPKSWLAMFQHFLRMWDHYASTRVDYYIANSINTQRRIKKYYQKASTIIHPPVRTNLQASKLTSSQVSNFLIVSRLFRHKNIHLAIKAFSKLEWPLYVIGDGPEYSYLKNLARQNGGFAKILGYQSDAITHEYLANCSAFVMPQEEDFGIAPIEALSYGKPVLALKRGGALEYIQESINGEFFEDPCEEMLADGARRLKENLPYYDQEDIKRTAERFSYEAFTEKVQNFLNQIT